jgi:hypothetical protein
MSTNTQQARFGFKWSVNEVLSLQREFELLGWSIDEIAQKHQRTPNAIMYKLDQEGFADYNELYSAHHGLNTSLSNKNSTQLNLQSFHSDSDDDFEQDDDDDEDFEDEEDDDDEDFEDEEDVDDEDEDEDDEIANLSERLDNLEESISEIKYMIKQFMTTKSTSSTRF